MISDAVFGKYAQKVNVHDAGTVKTCKAYIQPLRYKNKMYLDGIYTEIGFNSQGHYLYIGPPAPDLTSLTDSGYISADGTSYRIDRAEKVYMGEEVFYIWAIIRTIVEVT